MICEKHGDVGTRVIHFHVDELRAGPDKQVPVPNGLSFTAEKAELLHETIDMDFCAYCVVDALEKACKVRSPKKKEVETK